MSKSADAYSDTFEIVFSLLQMIAEDPMLRPSHRVTARQQLWKLLQPLCSSSLAKSAPNFLAPVPDALVGHDHAALR